MTLNRRAEFERALPAGFDGEFEWSFLAGAFPRDIMPMDIDGCVEIESKFLLFETKNPGLKVKKGQQQTLRRFLQYRGVSIIFTNGKRYDEFRSFMYYHRDYIFSFSSDYSHEVGDKIFEVCKLWAEAVRWSDGLTKTQCENLGLRQRK